jgi:CheY-like chemotaxis protein
MEIVTAASGQEALEQIKRNPDVDIALIDIMMPGMDGHELIRILRASPDTKKIPIIVVTAKTMPEDRKQSIDAGASDYITKPIDLDQLLSLMRVWLY